MNVYQIDRLARRRVELKAGTDIPYYVGDLVYLPTNWKKSSLPARQKPLYEVALQRPWSIEKISFSGGRPNYELQQQNVPDSRGTLYKITDYATEQDLKRGLREYVSRMEADERREREEKQRVV